MKRRFAPWPFWAALALVMGTFIYFPVGYVLLILAALVLLAVAGMGVWRQLLLRRFKRKWRPQGKDLLLVYSNSPHWQEYIEQRWLPLLAPRAVVLNWSERSRWRERHPLEGAIARHWGGMEEYNPIALLISDDAPIAEVRFWQAFRDYKHDNVAPLRRAEQELGKLLGIDFPAH